MKNQQALIEKLEASAASERALGNHDAADVFAQKAATLRRKHNLPKSAPVKEPPKTVSTVRPRPFNSDFPGVPQPAAALTNEQLQELRQAAADRGRPLSDAERADILGIKNTQENQICFL